MNFLHCTNRCKMFARPSYSPRKAMLERRLQALERSRDISAAKPSLLQPSDVKFTSGRRFDVFGSVRDRLEPSADCITALSF